MALQTVGIGKPAAVDALVDIAEHLILEGDVLLSSGDDLVLKNIFQVILSHVQSERFAAFDDAKSLLDQLRSSAVDVVDSLSNGRPDIAWRKVIMIRNQAA
jgi:hypothetical protein